MLLLFLYSLAMLLVCVFFLFTVLCIYIFLLLSLKGSAVSETVPACKVFSQDLIIYLFGVYFVV